MVSVSPLAAVTSVGDMVWVKGVVTLAVLLMLVLVIVAMLVVQGICRRR